MNFDLEQGMAVLDRTPAVLEQFLVDLPSCWTSADEGPETWSPFDVLGHLICGEETDWIERLRIILDQGPDRRFKPFDRFRQIERDKGRELAALVADFRRLRERNLVTLRALNPTPAQLALTGEHPKFGTVTAAQLLATWVAHDLGHIAQIARVMAKQYREAVGPWFEYMPILQR